MGSQLHSVQELLFSILFYHPVQLLIQIFFFFFFIRHIYKRFIQITKLFIFSWVFPLRCTASERFKSIN